MAIEHGHSAIAELLIEAGHEAVEHRHFFDPGVVPIHEDEEEEGTLRLRLIRHWTHFL